MYMDTPGTLRRTTILFKHNNICDHHIVWVMIIKSRRQDVVYAYTSVLYSGECVCVCVCKYLNAKGHAYGGPLNFFYLIGFGISGAKGECFSDPQHPILFHYLHILFQN